LAVEGAASNAASLFRDAPSRKRKNRLSIYAEAAIRHCHRHLYDYSCPRRRPPLATGM